MIGVDESDERARVVGVDIRRPMTGARGFNLVQADVRHLPFPPACFSGLQSVLPTRGLLEALQDRHVLSRLARLLKEGARVNIIVDQPPIIEGLETSRIKPVKKVVGGLKAAVIDGIPAFSQLTSYQLKPHEVLSVGSPTIERMRHLGSLPPIHKIKAKRRAAIGKKARF